MLYRSWCRTLLALMVLSGLEFNSTREAVAGGSTGGGNVVVCTSPLRSNETIQLLDYYEARVFLPSLKLDLSQGKTELEKVNRVLDRLARVDGKRTAKYRKQAENFFEEVRWVAGMPLANLNDYGYVPLQPNCRIEQVAMQRPTPFPEAKLYTIRKEFYEGLTLEDRAGLILHEIIYGDALSKGHKNSVNARYFNALVSSENLERLTQAEYDTRLVMIGLSDGSDTPPPPPPHWVMNPVRLPGAQVTMPYRASLAGLVKMPVAGDAIRFRKVSGPEWLEVASDGTVFGTPERSNEGENAFTVCAQTSGGTADASVLVIVNKTPAPPTWVVNPIDLGIQTPGTALSFDISKLLKYDGSIISYYANMQPTWMTLSRTGQLTGTPLAGNLGRYAFEVMACEPARNCAAATVKGEVKSGSGSVKWTTNNIVLHPAMEDVPYAENLRRFIVTPQTGPVNFSGMGLPSWMSLDQQGHVTGHPKRADVGEYTFRILAQAGEQDALAVFRIHVLHTNHPPTWVNVPSAPLQARVGRPFTVSLDTWVGDADGDMLKISKISGPAWLTLSPSGILMGTPAASDKGESLLVLRVTDVQGLYADTTIKILVGEN